jgi:Fe-S cluster biogenesis protein NfuA
VASDASAGIGGEGGLMDKINRVLDTQIRPALAGDGGGLEVLGLDGKNLQIRYQGACGSCPSSIAGTLAAIQNLLQAEVDEGLVVTAG